MFYLESEMNLTSAILFGWKELKKMERSVSRDAAFILIQDLSLKEQSYRLELAERKINISVRDDAGAMYAFFDLADSVIDGWFSLEPVCCGEPYMMQRGIKFNIPLDARTPSYSDASDIAAETIEYIWDFTFWKNYLNHMARNKYNALTLWSLSPFPSLVRIPEYPLTALADVKKTTRPIRATTTGLNMFTKDVEESLVTVKRMTIEEKIAFWQMVMEYASDRCIRIFLFTWNVYAYGTENSPYGITADQNNPVTEDYLYCAVKALLRTYPLLAGIGITAGENMKRDETDIPFLVRTYGRAVSEVLKEQKDRQFSLIQRYHYSDFKAIRKSFADFSCPFYISFKYSQAHMYSSTAPQFIREFHSENKGMFPVWLTVRNDDFYYLQWGDPDFARDYIRNMPKDGTEGFYLGADGYTWGIDLFDKKKRHGTYLQKHRYEIAIWGRLSYCPQLGNSYFKRYLEREYHVSGADSFYLAWKEVSKIIPYVTCVHWHNYDFQWYPEGCCCYDQDLDKLLFADINEFMDCPAMPGGDYLSVKDYCSAVLGGKAVSQKHPLQAAEDIKKASENAIEYLNRCSGAEKGTREFQEIAKSIRLNAMLGIYYSKKIRAAVTLCFGCLKKDNAEIEAAAALLKSAAKDWRQYSGGLYRICSPSQMARLCSYVDLRSFNRYAELDCDLALEHRFSGRKDITAVTDS